MTRKTLRKRSRKVAKITDTRTIHVGGGGSEVGVAPDDFTDDLIDLVWSYLPIVSAVKFSLVWRKYTDLWRCSRYFDFGKSIVGGKFSREVAKLVNSAFRLHLGLKIDKFKLYINPNGLEPDLCRWIRRIIELNVEEIELDYSPSYSPPLLCFSLHGVRTLTSLKLVNVRVDGSNRFVNWSGLINLRELSLRGCYINHFKVMSDKMCSLECLEIVNCKNVSQISICGLKHERLRTLKVGSCWDLKEIEVDAPTLKIFYYHGYRRRILVKSSLEQMFFSHSNLLKRRYGTENHEKNLLDPIAESLKVLTVNSDLTEFQVLCPVVQQWDLGSPQVTFSNLTELQFKLQTITVKQVGFVRGLLRYCPRLETLHIDLDCCKNVDGAKRLTKRNTWHPTDDHQFNLLKVIKIKGFRYSRLEQCLLEYIVTRSTTLQTVALVGHKNFAQPDCQSYFLNIYLSQVSLSPAMKICLYDYNNDLSCISPTHNSSWYLT